MNPPIFGASMSKSLSGNVTARHLDRPVGQLGLRRDLDGLGDAVELQVADERDVDDGPGKGRGGHLDRLGQGEGRGRELVGLEALGAEAVVAPASSDVRLVVSTVIVPSVSVASCRPRSG